MSSAAQDEFDTLYNNNQGKKLSGHPEDRSDSSDNDSTTLHSGNEDERTLTSNSSTAMPHATTYLPTTTQFDANTGPKGVIADARSFETAKKRNFRQTLYAFSNSLSREKSKSPSPELSADDEEEDFMRQWRANRIDELTRNNQDVRTRRQSPSQRRYGSLVTVDPSGYLDAVEKVHAYTTVVVLIYDDESTISNQVEDALKVIARNHATTRFIKLHFLDAEMDEIAAPGILAYKGGECFANLISVINEIPAGRDLNSATLEGVLQEYVNKFSSVITGNLPT
ncbi:hypothetical protein OEA41_010166 [Lepraria neglecta]|uniref:Phosducin domain-containing protein n=1 Tax=Lepraria neglecta TaxID=209136 RepID=A0AAD9YW18_9LECA|nr:hypothetical protein OEA41_010166 [Lepraria neglecta]